MLRLRVTGLLDEILSIRESMCVCIVRVCT